MRLQILATPHPQKCTPFLVCFAKKILGTGPKPRNRVNSLFLRKCTEHGSSEFGSGIGSRSLVVTKYPLFGVAPFLLRPSPKNVSLKNVNWYPSYLQLSFSDCSPWRCILLEQKKHDPPKTTTWIQGNFLRSWSQGDVPFRRCQKICRHVNAGTQPHCEHTSWMFLSWEVGG